MTESRTESNIPTFTTMRVARPTDHLEDVTRFYRDGLGLAVLFRFEDHDGFDGVILGLPHVPYHLEFTQRRGHRAGVAPTLENLLVFYVPDEREWTESVARLKTCGYTPVPSFNPFWDQDGITFEDPDGYRVVLQHAAWTY